MLYNDLIVSTFSSFSDVLMSGTDESRYFMLKHFKKPSNLFPQHCPSPPVMHNGFNFSQLILTNIYFPFFGVLVVVGRALASLISLW